MLDARCLWLAGPRLFATCDSGGGEEDEEKYGNLVKEHSCGLLVDEVGGW